MRKSLLPASALSLVLLVNTSAEAACRCLCVGGAMQAVCSSSVDLPPVCPPTLCGIPPPSLAPVPSPTLPPLGTRSCSQRQVENRYTGRYEWREICR